MISMSNINDMHEISRMLKGMLAHSIDKSSSIDPIIDILRGRISRPNRVRVLDELHPILGQEDIARLIQYLSDDDDAIAEAIVNTMRWWYEIIPQLINGLATSNARGRQLVIGLLVDIVLMARITDERLVTALLDYLNDFDARVRAKAVEALGWLGDMHVEKIVLVASADSDVAVRQTAVWALGHLQGAQITDTLVSLLADPVTGVRAQAAASLGHLHDRRAIEPLYLALHDPHPAVRRHVGETLRLFGIDQGPASPTILTPQINDIAPLRREGAILPDELQEAVNQALAAMHAHSQHHLLPSLREPIYAGFGSQFDPAANKARTLLSTWTARRVLPIFERVAPQDGDARSFIELGEDVLTGMIAPAEARQRLDQEGGGQGPDLGQIGQAAGFAYEAAVWSVLGRVGLDYATDEQTDLDDQLDAAAAAAMAEAWNGINHKRGVHPDKLREFWEWWLTQAVPAAWLARQWRLELISI